MCDELQKIRDIYLRLIYNLLVVIHGYLQSEIGRKSENYTN